MGRGVGGQKRVARVKSMSPGCDFGEMVDVPRVVG